MKNKSLYRLAALGMLAAISIVLIALIRIPLFINFLVYDPADIVILIGTMIFGPISGLMLTVVVAAIQAVIFNPESGIIGFLMHTIATGGMVVLCWATYKMLAGKAKLNALSQGKFALALFVGGAFMVISMVPMNLLLTPIYTKMAAAEIWKEFMFVFIIPFNLVKAGINTAATFLIFPLLIKIIKTEKLKAFL